MRIEKLTEKHGQFLVVDSDGGVMLRRRNEINVEGDLPIVVINIKGALGTFRRLVGSRTRLHKFGVQTCGGATWKQIRRWKEAGLIAPIEVEVGVNDWYSIETGFTAALLGGLRRAGQPMAVLKAVADMCREPATVEASTEPETVKV